MERTVEDYANEFASKYRIQVVDYGHTLKTENSHVIGQEIEMKFKLQSHQYNNLETLSNVNDVNYQFEADNVVRFTSYSTSPIDSLLNLITII